MPPNGDAPPMAEQSTSDRTPPKTQASNAMRANVGAAASASPSAKPKADEPPLE